MGVTVFPLWEGYKVLPRKDLMAFLEDCGVETSLSVETSAIPYTHPYSKELRYGFGSARYTSTSVNIDYRIDQLPAMLALGDPAISRLIWDAVREVGAVSMVARYAPNQSYAAHVQPSSLALTLRATAWIPSKDGTLRKPSEMTAGDLARGYALGGNDDWLKAIGVGEIHRQRSEQHKARRQAGEIIGLPPELVDQLGGLPPEAIAALSADVLRKIAARSYEQAEFPEREAGNPSRRSERLSARAKAAPLKKYEVRERSIRVSSVDSRALARTYLEDHYTNHLGDMVCQGCQQKMPFNMPDGSPYFEAVECLDGLQQEQAENHLALCPTCAAKWRHANPVTDDSLRKMLSSANEPEISVMLAGEPTRLRFTKVHLEDIRTVGGVDAAQ